MEADMAQLTLTQADQNIFKILLFAFYFVSQTAVTDFHSRTDGALGVKN